jgi:hypothetical protein
MGIPDWHITNPNFSPFEDEEPLIEVEEEEDDTPFGF